MFDLDDVQAGISEGQRFSFPELPRGNGHGIRAVCTVSQLCHL